MIAPRTDEDSPYDKITVLCEAGYPGGGKCRLSTGVPRTVLERLGLERVAVELRRHAVDLSPCSWDSDEAEG